jgi:disulfide oxidoreductase YuzD
MIIKEKDKLDWVEKIVGRKYNIEDIRYNIQNIINKYNYASQESSTLYNMKCEITELINLKVMNEVSKFDIKCVYGYNNQITVDIQFLNK